MWWMLFWSAVRANELCDGGGALPVGAAYAVESDAVFQPVNGTSPGGGDQFGESLAVGDFNGDGTGDLAIGAPTADAPGGNQADVGVIRVWFGGVGFSPPCVAPTCTSARELDGDVRPPDLVLHGAVPGAQLELTLAVAGDLTHDAGVNRPQELLVGGNEVVMVVDLAEAVSGEIQPTLTFSSPSPPPPLGAPRGFGHLIGAVEVGSESVVWIGELATKKIFFYREDEVTGVWLNDPVLELAWSTAPNGVFTSVAAFGQWEGGGTWLAVGCSQCTQAEGQVAIWDATDLLGTVDLHRALPPGAGGPVAARSGPINSRTGASLIGFDDGVLAIGATHSTSSGKVWLIDDASPTVLLDGPQLIGSNQGRLGTTVAALDIDHDGQQDIVSGAPQAFPSGGPVRGMVRFGDGYAPGATPPAVDSPMFMWGPPHPSPVTGARFGRALASGDINGDGFDDLLIGAPKANYANEAGDVQDFGAVFLLYGGTQGHQADPVWVYEDTDGDGYGNTGASMVQRCFVGAGYSLNNEDCDDSASGVHPGALESCTTLGDDDCLSANDGLCGHRFATTPVGVETDLTGSLWCHADNDPVDPGRAWQIGPRTTDVASVASLAQMVVDGSLFFGSLDDDLQATGPVTASACTPAGAEATVLLDVMSAYPDPELPPYPALLTTAVVDKLRNHPDGYFIGTLPTAGAPQVVVIGGAYPGLVNGVVELLRTVETNAEGPQGWPNNVVLDYPENRLRVVRGEASFLSCVGANTVPVNPEDWASDTNCAGAEIAAARDAVDTLLYYHFSGLRANLSTPLTITWHNIDLNANNQQTKFVTHHAEFAIYLRKRGIDLLPRVGALPQFNANRIWEPLGVLNMPFEPVVVGTERLGMPCDDDECSTPAQELAPDGYRSNKYWMELSGPDAGVVYARNMLGGVAGVATSVASDPAGARTACAGQPCFVSSTTIARDIDDAPLLVRDQKLSLYLADDSVDEPSPWTGERHDWKYDQHWGPSMFRPGRSYALHADVETLSVTGSGTPVVDFALGHEDDLTTRVILDTESAISVSFVFRAPLQWSESPTGELLDRQGLWNYGGLHPSVTIRVSGDDDDASLAAATYVSVRLSNLTLVELDGLSTGWMKQQDDLGADVEEVAAAGEEVGVMMDIMPGVTLDGCPQDECVPYVYTNPCNQDYADRPLNERERFSNELGASLTVDHLVRVSVPAGDGPFHVSGVLRPILGSYRVPNQNLCGYTDRVLSSFQTVDLFAPQEWGTYGVLPSALRFLAAPRADLEGHSLRDFIWGGSAHYPWHTVDKELGTTVASETRIMNIGFAGWRDGVYRPVSHHQALRATFCNIALAVDAPWAGPAGAAPLVPYKRWCDFAGAGEACDETLAALNGPERCDLSAARVARAGYSSGFEVEIDSNMHRDAQTANSRMYESLLYGASHASMTTSDVSLATPTAAGDATVANTLASTVNTRLWDAGRDWHEVLENLCDVADLSDSFVHPGVGVDFGATLNDVNACMMSGREPADPSNPSTVAAMAMLSVVDYPHPQGGVIDSVRYWSSLAAAMPTLVGAVEASVQVDPDGSGSMPPTMEYPFLGYAARCFWNPEWAYLGAVSADAVEESLFEPGFESPWCPSGSKWIAQMLHTTASYDSSSSANWWYRYNCLDFGINVEHERNSCVRATAAGALWMGMRPEPSALVSLEGEELEGQKVRATMTVGFKMPQSVERSCETAKVLSGVLSSVPGAPVLPQVGGRLFFLDAQGRMLAPDGSVVNANPSCETEALTLVPDDPSPEEVKEGVDVQVWPMMARRIDNAPIASLIVEGVVPPGASHVGAVVRVPGVPVQDDFREPVLSSVVFERKLPGDPKATAAVSSQASTPVALSHTPNSCSDPAWFGALALQPTDCLMDFAGGEP